MSAAAVEIWLRRKGVRRQAFYRTDSTCAWQRMQVTHADKALRIGTMKLGETVFPVVPRETSDVDAHPAAAQFAAQARYLNGQIDVINQRGCASLSALQITALVAFIALVLTSGPALLDGPSAAQAEQDVQDEVAALTASAPVVAPVRPQHPSAGLPARTPHASVVAAAR